MSLNYGEVEAHKLAWVAHMRPLLGKRVRVTIDQRKPTTVEGELLYFDEGGEVALRAEDGFISWSWPNLETVAL